MKLWLVSRPGNQVGYDEFDSMVVAAAEPADAILIHPRGELVWRMMTADEADEAGDPPREAWLPKEPDGWRWSDNTWGEPVTLTVIPVGESLPETPAGAVILASFNAG